MRCCGRELATLAVEPVRTQPLKISQPPERLIDVPCQAPAALRRRNVTTVLTIDDADGLAAAAGSTHIAVPPVPAAAAPPAADGKIMPTEDDDGRLGGPSNSEARPISNVLARAARLTMIEQT